MLGRPITPPARGERAANRALPVPPWLIASLLLVVAVIAERWVLSQHTFSWDVWADRVGMSNKAWLPWIITRAYQQVGRPLVAIGEVVAMAAWLWHTGGRRSVQGLVVALGASAMNGAIKIVCGPTPFWHGLPHHVGTNFPSGVVTFMTASGGYLALVAWRQGRRVMPAVLVIAILGAGPMRVLGGQHLISDVFGAYMLGSAWLLAARAQLNWATRPSVAAAPPAPATATAGTAVQAGHTGTLHPGETQPAWSAEPVESIA